MIESILSDLFQGFVVSGLTAMIFWVWNLRATRLAAQKVTVVFAGPDGAVCDPGVSIRRDECTRAEILGRCGAAVGGFAAGVSFPGVDPVQLDAVKAGRLNTLSLVFTDAGQFAKAVEGVEVVAGRKFRPVVNRRVEPAVTLADLEEMKNSILQVVRAQAAVAKVPALKLDEIERRIKVGRKS